jgi:diacylglycerol kinase
MSMGRHSPLASSFRFAWDGIVDGAVRDRNLRIQLGLGALAGTFAALAPLAPAERAVLVLCAAAVIGAEARNSALESAVDLASPGLDERARFAKDAAAGSVLALSAGSVLAFLAIAVPHAPELLAWARALPPGAAVVRGSAALAAALAAGWLPAPWRRPVAADVLLAATGAAGILVLAASAESQVGTAVAALCLAAGATGAARRRRIEPDDHSS